MTDKPRVLLIGGPHHRRDWLMEALQREGVEVITRPTEPEPIQLEVTHMDEATKFKGTEYREAQDDTRHHRKYGTLVHKSKGGTLDRGRKGKKRTVVANALLKSAKAKSDIMRILTEAGVPTSVNGSKLGMRKRLELAEKMGVE